MGTTSELILLVEEALEGGYTAGALGESIFTEAEDLEGLHANVRDAVRCHFDEGPAPRMIRLHDKQAGRVCGVRIWIGRQASSDGLAPV